MKLALIAVAATAFTMAAAQAQSTPKSNPEPTGTAGAHVATTPQQVKEQQGATTKSSAGTVGAAPMTPSASQTPDKGK